MIEKEEIVNARFTILLRIIITLTTITIIPILISDSESQQEQGVTPVDSQMLLIKHYRVIQLKIRICQLV
ncbi:MAG TPA: hypothetical protein VLA74_00365 [Nitrososphaeraceae archaeon]|jgi:hypothetical protein|nr:hypothetical protein [Nitrososphaeraceae archaeon]